MAPSAMPLHSGAVNYFGTINVFNPLRNACGIQTDYGSPNDAEKYDPLRLTGVPPSELTWLGVMRDNEGFGGR